MAQGRRNSVATHLQALRALLQRAREIKPHAGIEPALTYSDFGAAIDDIGKRPGTDFLAPNSSHYAAIETACREIFYGLVVRRPLEVSSSRFLRYIGYAFD